MTSLMPHSSSSRSRDDAERVRNRSLPLVAAATGAVAAAAPLVVCLGLGVVGWFLTDSGAHGAPRDGLRTGAMTWLMAHGSGVHVEGVAITAIPLGLTLVCAWACWRLGHRLGVAVSGYGPDAHDIADGQRDWTVPVAAALFAAGYVVVAVTTCTLAATPTTAPDASHVVLWAMLLCLVVALPGVAVGSGRASIWAGWLPGSAQPIAAVCRWILLAWLALGLVAFTVALVADAGTAANVTSQLDSNAGAVALIVLVSALVLPNAMIFSGSYLLGPGFAVGAGTSVSANVAVIGPLPAFPMLAALPDEGAAPGWTAWLVAVPYLVAFAAVVLVQRRQPVQAYDESAIRGGVGGLAAGVIFAVLASLSGGAVGPGRMADVGPFAFDALLHGVAGFGIGGLLGGLAMTWWQRRGLRLETDVVLVEIDD